MGNYIHIALEDSLRGSLWWCLNKSDNKLHKYYGDVRNFKEHLSVGPLYKLDIDLLERIEWYKNLYLETEHLEHIKKVEMYILKSYQLELNIPKNERIIIWHGNNACEQIALMYLVNRFKDNEIYEANVSNFVKKKLDGSECEIKSTYQCGPREVEKALDNIKYIDKYRKNYLIELWNKLNKEKGTLRVIKDNNIINVDESYFDKNILKHITNDFQVAAKVIGDVMSELDNNISDTFINYRLRIIIKEGKVDTKGSLQSIKDFEVKKIN